MLYDYLVENYESGEPIFLVDIQISGVSDGNLRYYFQKLVEEAKICRFDSGVYYLPSVNFLGEKKDLSADTVAQHKYIMRKGERVGYYSGFTLANRLGLSTQVPYTEEIVSNYAPAPVRKVEIKDRKYMLRRPVTTVTNENYPVLQFLDCLKDLESCAELPAETCGLILSHYAEKYRITKNKIDQFISLYPLKVYKAIYDTGVKYVSA